MLRPDAVELVPHDPRWVEHFLHEADRWQVALGPALLDVHHIGSTAIPGIAAKPILDLIPEFVSPVAMDESRAEIEAMGYDWRGEYGLPGRRYCTLRDPQSGRRLVHAHGYASGSTEIERHLAFRDYLRAHPEIAEGYAAEKERCRLLHPHDSAAYSEAKHAWIQTVQAAAIVWFRNQHHAAAERPSQ